METNETNESTEDTEDAPESEETEAITVLALAKFRGVKEDERGSINAGQVYDVGLPFFGGCSRCHASIACYNACPSRDGYLKCRDCIDTEDGFATAEEANRFLFPDEYEWKGVKKPPFEDEQDN